MPRVFCLLLMLSVCGASQCQTGELGGLAAPDSALSSCSTLYWDYELGAGFNPTQDYIGPSIDYSGILYWNLHNESFSRYSLIKSPAGGFSTLDELAAFQAQLMATGFPVFKNEPISLNNGEDARLVAGRRGDDIRVTVCLLKGAAHYSVNGCGAKDEGTDDVEAIISICRSLCVGERRGG